MANQSKKTWIILAIALLLILIGDLLASCVQTDWGNVQVKDIRFMGTSSTDDTNNVIMSALLYVPKTATAATPAPGILAIHGYINSRETQDGFAIEFARRGYVVLAMDQTGHGYSGGPAFANGFGGPDGLKYLASLDIVDKNNIGLEGHSMGGSAVATAADAYPDLYKAMVLEGSSTAPAPAGDANFPKNLGVVFGQWEEFSGSMWGADIPRNIVSTDQLKEQFGTDKDVVVGQLYGSIEKGTARELWMPQNTHPGDHISTAAIGDAIYWFQQTLKGGNGLPPANQAWYWKEIGNLIALIGMILLLFPVGSLLLQTKFFKGIAEATPEPRTVKGIGWWIGAILLVAIPAVTYFPFTDFGAKLNFTSAIFPQIITGQIMVWALMNAAISIVLFVLWHFIFNRKANGGNYGLAWGTRLEWGKIGKALLLAVVVAFVAYLTLVLSGLLFNVDYRIWVFAVKPMSLLQFRMFLCYLIPFIIFFLVLATVLQGELRPFRKNGQAFGLCGETWINIALLVLGFVGLILYQYIPLIAGGTLAINNPLFSIIAFQFLPIMTIAALVFTYFFRKTGHVYTGVFLIAILIVWIVVASQATHIAI